MYLGLVERHRAFKTHLPQSMPQYSWNILREVSSSSVSQERFEGTPGTETKYIQGPEERFEAGRQIGTRNVLRS